MASNQAKQLSAMIDQLYAAALDPLRWSDFLSSFATAVNSESAALFVHDFSSRRSTFKDDLALGSSVNLDPAYMATFDYFSTVNPWTAREGNLAEGVAVTGCMLLPANELVRTEWFGDWLRPQDLFHSLGGVVMREDERAIKVTALRPLHRGDYTADEMGVYELLVPHMHRAIAIHRRAVDDHALSRGACAALDSITTGVILLCADGTIAHCNAAALALLHRSGTVRIRRRRLAFFGTALQSRYESALHECVRLGRIEASSDARSRFDEHFGPFDGIRFTVAPIRADDPWQYGADIRAAIFLTTDQKPMLDLDTVRTLYGLTTAEARLAVHLVHGLTLDAYAQERHLTRNTVVSQLKSVLKKTGARGQADVVRLLLSSPAAALSKA